MEMVVAVFLTEKLFNFFENRMENLHFNLCTMKF